MSYTVSITSQGQISIPASLRRQFNLAAGKKASVFVEDGKIIIEPIPDLLSIGGSLKTNKKFSIKEEKEAFAKYFGRGK